MIDKPAIRFSLVYLIKNGMRKEEIANKCSMPKNIVYWGTKT
jgi:hypothetical protein